MVVARSGAEVATSIESTLLEMDRAHVWHPFTQAAKGEAVLPVVGSKGSYLHLDGGRRVLDGISSWWCNLHGHCHPKIVEAISYQAQTLDHVLFAGCTHEPATLLAAELLPLLPTNQKRVFFSDNGSTAIEIAIKMAVQYARNVGKPRRRLLALNGAYHGDTFGAMSVGARGVFSAPFEELFFETSYLSPNGGESEFERCRALCSSNDVAAFIFEPLIQGVAGMQPYQRSVLETYMGIAHESGALCIADEVMTGFGRTGPLFVSAGLAHAPDIMCLSKGLTGGTLPLALTTCSSAIYEAFLSLDHSRTFFHGHTYTANPIACAAARASLALSISPECADQRMRISKAHESFVATLSDHRVARRARSVGTILALDIEADGRTLPGYGSPTGEHLSRHFLNRDVLLRPLGNILYFMPPYCFTDQQLHHVYGSILDVLQELSD